MFFHRALKTRGNTPKYGLIFHSTFIGRAGAKNKGRISRYLANKCSIASRVDNFSGKLVITLYKSQFFLIEGSQFSEDLQPFYWMRDSIRSDYFTVDFEIST